jgi:hypothetical protein
VLFLATLARIGGTTISTSIHPYLDDFSAIYRPNRVALLGRMDNRLTLRCMQNDTPMT